MNKFLSSRVSSIPASPTLEMAATVHKLKEAGHSVISFALGEPQFQYPQAVVEGVNAYLSSRRASYPALKGKPALLESIADYYKEKHGLEFARDQIIVGNGGKQILANAFFATLNPEDEVIIPSPYWVSYPLTASLAGGKSIFLDLEEKNGFQISVEQLESVITDKTKWLMLNTPSNPTGAILDPQSLENIATVLRRYPHILVLLDEIYERLTFDGMKYHSLATVAPDLRDRILHLNGASKAYAMTGWRVGYALGPVWLISAMASIQGNTTSGVCEAAQAATTAAIKHGDQDIAESLKLYQERRDLICSLLNDMGLEVQKPQGAFYVFPSIKKFLGKTSKKFGKISSDVDFCKALLEEKYVACVPGNAFGRSGYIRMSYAGSEEDITKGCQLLKEFLLSLT